MDINQTLRLASEESMKKFAVKRQIKYVSAQFSVLNRKLKTLINQFEMRLMHVESYTRDTEQ